MNTTRFDQSLPLLAGATGRRDAVRSLGAIGTALLAALGFSGAQARSNHGGTGKSANKDRAPRRNRNRSANRPHDETEEAPEHAPGEAPPDRSAVQAERKRRKKKKPRPTGPPLSLVTITAPFSGVLGATAGSEVVSTAECGPASTPLNCGWLYQGAAGDFEHTTTQVGPGFLAGVGFCKARLRRTTAVATAGGRIAVTAICTR